MNMLARSIPFFLVGVLLAHEGGRKDLKPTKAQADLKASREQLNVAKKKLAGQGRYSCCVKPACDLCARVTGSCACAENVAKGLGACGECYGGWKAGRGVLKGIDPKTVKLLPAEKQQAGGTSNPPSELRQSNDALLRAKRILVTEKRFFCCIRGGCSQCAHEANCPCGSDLAGAKSSNAAKAKGVCGDCLDGWHAGHGAFAGIPLSEVTLAPMEAMDDAMGPGGGPDSGWYSSGTSQIPRAAPMNMLYKRAGAWSLSLHGVIFGIYTNQTGPRGRDKIFSANWFMPMLSRRLGPGTLSIRSMFSLEPATVTNRRYPLLLQEGETAYGIPILNGQHPHDFIMELGAAYQIRLGDRTALNFYGGPRGEPALGPTAYPHRLSTSENPIAVLSHHYQDSTHISTNVITAGITHGPVTWEVSGFHGREPDEKRWGLERGEIDSLSTRLTITPTARWTGQFSIGRINNREATHPVRDSLRTTASLMYVKPLASGHWATSLIWGRNHDLTFTQPPSQFLPPAFPRSVGLLRAAPLTDGFPQYPQHIVSVPTRIPGQIYNSYVAESTLFFKKKHWIWGRVESADKDSLLLFEEQPFVLLAEEQRFTRVQAYTAGYEHELPRAVNWLSSGLGGQVTIFHAPQNLEPVYGGHPVGIQVFIRLRLGQLNR